MAERKPKSSNLLVRLWTRCKVSLQGRSRGKTFVILFLFVLLIIFTIQTVVAAVYPNEESELVSSTSVLRGKDHLFENIDYDQCEWIEKLLKDGEPVGPPLPKAGKARKAGIFWLKSPLLHTRVKSSTIPTLSNSRGSVWGEDPEVDIMVLKYNIYNEVQHKQKFSNTVKVLEKYSNDKYRLFPKLYGHCRDYDGFHTLVVEFIDYNLLDLDSPRTLEKCVERADKALLLFQTLDEEYNMTLVDFKPGQWMARKDGTLVLQDVDDIVPTFSPNPYKDQIEWHKKSLARANKVDFSEVDRRWKTDMFPEDKYTIRYPVLAFDILLNDLGFRWNSNDCDGINSRFNACKEKVLRWTRSLSQDFPSPAKFVKV
eukprot:CAMPEP_0184021510 /NCGR_PEP_ID=MMETSP0954-20121128/9978_1 /TAXON_ID=627963 /ORGANISM="Aplanochytrium sp, Strain PBS07" /LENGTH=369 /DNA_ID=CAMNT_0026303557 /DNA_START=99 /DNA_END=1209 /DNA_ORIENTATION=-